MYSKWIYINIHRTHDANHLHLNICFECSKFAVGRSPGCHLISLEKSQL